MAKRSLTRAALVPALLAGTPAFGQEGPASPATVPAEKNPERHAAFLASKARLIETGWRSLLVEAPGGVSAPVPSDGDRRWRPVPVPHNWQGYAFDRRVVDGSRHGSAWYRTDLTIAPRGRDERLQLMFEGVSAYATVWLNGRLVGRHAGGLTSFTLDVTDAARPGVNRLVVRADLPAGITDLPWVNGGDQPTNGFSEGSQPLGIFRPVRLIRTAALRIRPFGIYAWGAPGAIDAAHADLNTRTEIENVSRQPRRFTLVTQLVDGAGRVASESRTERILAAGAQDTIDGRLPTIARPRLWSPADPALYTLRARLMAGTAVVDETSTPYGIRTVAIVPQADGTRRLLVNGRPFTIRGTSEYEHLLGNSHAFAPQQIDARVTQVEQAGFNAFRDAHYPHNLRYGDRIARDGLMWWPQFSSHIWFDNPAFRANFKARIADWVRERRNNPAVFLWGLQNESILPVDFAREVSDLIRTLDPTASIERLIVTCNFGKGTDWNVPQNWSGTYGGDPAKFAGELARQGLVGEYGAWRTLGDHAEPPYGATAYTEDRFGALLGQKARLAESVADRSVGSFQWLLTTHENPGRLMLANGLGTRDALPPLDHVGPLNNKGLMTLWGEPLDGYYLYRAMQVPGARAPMVYLVSHTWPDRWDGPGVRSGIEAYSNCDAVTLFNDAGGRVPLGAGRRVGTGLFRWDAVPVRYDVLTARCTIGGTVRASDRIRLGNLPPAPDAATLVRDPAPITRGEAGRIYLYRVAAGGSDHRDAAGQLWQGDRLWRTGGRWGYRSWAQEFAGLDPRLGSRRATADVIEGTDDQALFRGARYGLDRLAYVFTAPPGRYRVDLFFVEPWYGRAGIDATGWRSFDVAVNGRTVIRDLDIFREAGFGHALRRSAEVESVDGRIEIGFPRAAAGQAIVSAIAISTDRPLPVPPPETGSDLIDADGDVAVRTYLAPGDPAYQAAPGRWTRLPPSLLDSDTVLPPGPDAAGTRRVTLREASDLWLALPPSTPVPAGWTGTDLTAGIATVAADATTSVPVRFAKRQAKASEAIAIPAGAPLLVQRTLPDVYAPATVRPGPAGPPMQAEEATIAGGTVARVLPGYDGAGYVALDPGGTVRWAVTTGIQGKLGMTLRYHLDGPAGSAAARAVVRDASGIVVATMPVTLAPGGAWQDAAIETATAINAGRYTVTFEWPGTTALAVDRLVQR